MPRIWLTGVSSTAALAFVASVAIADPIIDPNPGGMYVSAPSTSAVATYVYTPITTPNYSYTTTLLAYLNGSQILDQSYGSAYSTPTFLNAVQQVDATLASDNAVYGAPILVSSNTTLQSSSTAPTTNYTCDQLASYLANNDLPSNITNTNNVVTSGVAFGPITLNVDQCGDNRLNVNTGQTAFEVNVEEDFSIAEDVVTTDNYLTAATYEIDATTAPVASVEEPLTFSLFSGGLIGLGMFIRRRKTNKV